MVLSACSRPAGPPTTIHLVAIAHAAGISINWGDFSELSAVVPLLAKIYPNGAGDVNDFQRAGGMGFLIAQLLDAGLLHDDTLTIAGQGLKAYRNEPCLDDGRLVASGSGGEPDESILRPISRPFSTVGGLKLLRGNLGRAVIKTSAVRPDRHRVEAPAIVFNDQEELMAAFDRGELGATSSPSSLSGARANGMPELHKLTPPLGVLQDEGFKVALVTDGRMSGVRQGAGGHPRDAECLVGGPLAKVRTGDLIRLDATEGILEAGVSDDVLASRPIDAVDLTPAHFGLGRELFAMFRANAASAEQGAITWLPPRKGIEPPRPRNKRRLVDRREVGPRSGPLRLLAGGNGSGGPAMTIDELLSLGPVIPVIVIQDARQAAPLAKALVEGGVRVLEITLLEAALEAIERTAREVPGAIVGVGRSRIPSSSGRRARRGSPAVTPGLTQDLAWAARENRLPLLPGVMTPSEVISATAAGFDALKLFPPDRPAASTY